MLVFYIKTFVVNFSVGFSLKRAPDRLKCFFCNPFFTANKQSFQWF